MIAVLPSKVAQYAPWYESVSTTRPEPMNAMVSSNDCRLFITVSALYTFWPFRYTTASCLISYSLSNSGDMQLAHGTHSVPCTRSSLLPIREKKVASRS